MIEKKKEVERLMKETVEGWPEMEGKKKVVWGVDKAYENGRVPYERKWRGCIEVDLIGSKTLANIDFLLIIGTSLSSPHRMYGW